MLRLISTPLIRTTVPRAIAHSRILPRTMATANTPNFNKVLYTPLAESDPEVQNIIDKETWRQFTGLELIASEVCPYCTI